MMLSRGIRRGCKPPLVLGAFASLLAAMCVALAASASRAADVEPYVERDLQLEGIGLRVRVTPVHATRSALAERGEDVELRVSMRRLADDQPLSNLPIGAWLDREVSPLSGAVPVCSQRVAAFLSGGLLTRPLVDLTGYWVLTLDQEGSVSVLDPAVVFAGRSSLYKAVQLGGKPFDWVKTPDDASLFIALPEQREVAMMDLRSLQLQARVPVRGRPTRLALQPDGRLLWAALRGDAPDNATVSASFEGLVAIDTRDGGILHEVGLPAGHHEIAFSEDSRYAYISSRDSGRFTVIETASGDAVNDVELGGQPLSVLAMSTSQRVWVVDGEQGVIHRLDRRGRQLDRIALTPGVGPARLSPDGRYVLVVNPMQHQLYVMDALSGALLENVTVSGQPYDVMFTEQYAYVRALDNDQVALFPLAQLPKPEPQYIAAGTAPLSALPDLPIASTMTPNFERTGAFFVVPSERTVYHYMEGMNAPDRSLRAYGHTPLAALVAQRGLREVARGEYAATFTPPASGRMVLALAADSPEIRECIGFQVTAPSQLDTRADIRVRWLDDGVARSPAAAPVKLRFIVETANGDPVPGLRLHARIVPGRGGSAAHWPVAAGLAPGEYVLAGQLSRPGGYFVHVESVDRQFAIDRMAAPAAIVIGEVAEDLESPSRP